ncbi:hypothetical protein AC579_4610 [Pseudocercospora musae]|uniref:Uncharacterized protein n=1 Tax=Pseudocercospora musae TaxID=113226 RepID=A0A139I0M2_9PEZI|nr:hypothetical protein AC579_4610 [Pseudocercospora musae]
MAACWYGSETVGSVSSQGLSRTSNSSDLAIRLRCAEKETSFQEVVYHGDTQQWAKQQTWSDLNGHASPACINRDPGSVDYMMFLDLNDAINIYWFMLTFRKDGKSVLGYLDYLYAESSFDNLIRGYNIAFAAENTTAQIPYLLKLHAVPGSMPGNDTCFEPAVAGTGSDIIYYESGLDNGDLTVV